MSEDRLYMNLTDEVEIAISAFIRDAINTSNLNGLCGLDEEAPNPYEILERQLEFIQAKTMPDAIERVEFLKNHEHEADTDDFCKHCGVDLAV